MGNDQGKGSKGKESSTAGDSGKSAAARAVSSTEAKLVHAFEKYTSGLRASSDKILCRTDFGSSVCASLPEIGELLFDYCVKANGRTVTSKEGINGETYVSACNEVISATSDTRQMELYCRLFITQPSDKLSLQGAVRLLALCRSASYLTISPDVELTEPEDDSVLMAICTSLIKSETTVDEKEFCSWCSRMCPRLVKDLHNYVVLHLTGYESDGKSSNPSGTGSASKETVRNSTSILSHCTSSGSTGLNQSTLWLCSNLLPTSYIPISETLAACSAGSESNLAQIVLQNGWHVLYSSSLHGLSVNRFQHHVIGYPGPTLLFIAFDKYLYAVAIDTPWKESRSRWGGSDCSFLQILPEYRLCQSGEGIIHYNQQDRTVAKGIQVGRDPRTTFLKLDEELIHANYYGVDYKIKTVEVWGCGGYAKLEAFQKQKQWERREVDKQQNRKLVPEDWKESVDRHLLELGGVETNHAQRGDI